jgi:uncharacterized protein (DUF433 family)
MSLDWNDCPAVESIPGKVGGVWLFKDTRIPISVLFDNLEDGLTITEIRPLYEGLTEGHIIGLLEFLSKTACQVKTVQHAILAAEALLPGTPAPKGESDPRWQAIMKIEDFVETEPEAIWPFALKWGSVANEPDLTGAIATLLLERLLQYHFELIFPRVVAAVRESPVFADAFSIAYKLGQAEQPGNSEQFDNLREEIRLSGN